MQPPESPFSEDVIWEAGGGSFEFAQPSAEPTAARAVRRYLRRAQALGFPYESEAQILLRRFAVASDITAIVRETVAAGGYAASGATAAADAVARTAAEANAATDEGGPSLSRLPPNSTEEVRVGDLLCTHPLSCLFDTPFDQAVVLMTETIDPDMVTGFVLNKARKATINVLLSSGSSDTLRHIEWGPLLEEQLFNGGPILDRESTIESNLCWFHSYGSKVPGSRQLAPGLWLGGDLASVVALAKEADPAARGVKFVLGRSGWSHSQLKIELANGVWVRARPGQASPYAAHAALEAPPGPTVWKGAMHTVGMPHFASFPRSRLADKRLQRYFQLYMDEFFREPSKKGASSSEAARSAASTEKGGEKASPTERSGHGARRKRPGGSGAT